MRRAGGWLLGLVVVAAMGGGGWFALRRVFKTENVQVYLFTSEREPTTKALRKGARTALEECGGRVGRFRVEMINVTGEPMTEDLGGRMWIGTSGNYLSLGDIQPAPFFISVLDTHPYQPTGIFRVTPGCDRQGRAAARWAKSVGVRRAFLVRDSGSLRSTAVGNAFKASAEELKLTVDGPENSMTDRPGLVRRILDSGADLVFYSGEEAPYSTAYDLFMSLLRAGYTGKVATAEADPEVSLLATRPTLFEGMYVVSPFAPYPPAGSGPHVVAGYLAMKATLDAIDRANSIDPEALRRAAAKLPIFDATGASTRPCALYVARKGILEFVEELK